MCTCGGRIWYIIYRCYESKFGLVQHFHSHNMYITKNKDILKPGLMMSMLMTIFSNSSFCNKKVACSTMLEYNLHKG